jgi:hypothetical protein
LQLEQDVCPEAEEYVPLRHKLQPTVTLLVAGPSNVKRLKYEPATHKIHADILLAVLNEPAEHEEQIVAPAMALVKRS